MTLKLRFTQLDLDYMGENCHSSYQAFSYHSNLVLVRDSIPCNARDSVYMYVLEVSKDW